MGRVITVGEMLIDFTATDMDVSVQEAHGFARNPGGAPANVAVAVARLGGEARFVGCVGDDPFGWYLRQTIEGYGVGTEHVRLTRDAATSLAFVARHHGEPDFFFVRNPGADALLSPNDVQQVELDASTVIHFGSNSLAQQPIRSAIEALVAKAKAVGAAVSFDVNLRPAFWRDEHEAYEVCLDLLPQVDILKVNQHELMWLSGEHDVTQAVAHLSTRTPAVILCTLGSRGAAVGRRGWELSYVPSFPTTMVDATGAGDAFIGSVLYRLVADGLQGLGMGAVQGEQQGLWRDYARFGCAAAAHNVTVQGAIDAMPTTTDVMRILKR